MRQSVFVGGDVDPLAGLKEFRQEAVPTAVLEFHNDIHAGLQGHDSGGFLEGHQGLHRAFLPDSVWVRGVVAARTRTNKNAVLKIEGRHSDAKHRPNSQAAQLS